MLEPGQSLDPERDWVMLISVRGPSDNTPILLNGDADPGPIELKQGVRYRFRFINITPHDPLLPVSLLAGMVSEQSKRESNKLQVHRYGMNDRHVAQVS